MKIDDNKDAYQTMHNAIGSMENRMREIYNKGYKDGLRDGASQVTAKIVSKILEEVEADRKDEPQTIAEDINRRVEMGKKEWNARHIEDEPQTDCAWK